MSAENRNRIQLLEEHFRSGRFEPAELLLSILAQQKLPAEFAVRVAEIARRSGQSRLALETLRKAIGKKPLLGAAPELIAEFAANLGVLGDWKTSEKLFHRAQLSEHSRFALPRAIALMNGWEFESAIPLLRVTVAHSENPASRVSALLRLATCLLRSGERMGVEESHEILENFLKVEGQQAEFIPQKVYAIHLMTEWLFFAKKDSKAALANIEALIREFPKHDQTIPRTWQLLLSMRLSGMKPEWTDALQVLRETTRKSQQPHLVRLMDLLSATVLQEPNALARLWYGSPYPGIRKLLASRVPAQALPRSSSLCFPIHEEYGLTSANPVPSPSFNPDSANTALDLSRGSFQSNRENPFLKLGQATHRLMLLLCSDFYRPIPTIEIFSGLYPEEIFEPGPAETRVHAQVSRARKIILRETRCLTIEPDESGSGYLLKRLPLEGSGAKSKLPAHVSLITPNPDSLAPKDESLGKGARTLSRLEFEIATLRSALTKSDSPTGKASEPESFNSADAARIWDVSPRSANSRIKEALAAGKLQRIGSGPKVRYTFKGK